MFAVSLRHGADARGKGSRLLLGERPRSNPHTPEERRRRCVRCRPEHPGGLPKEHLDSVDPDAAQAWDPPCRFAVRTEQEDWFNALEFVIEARAGGTSLLRYVHSGILVDNWDNQYDADSQHTDFYLRTLSEYLEHFAGHTATYIGDAPAGIQGPPASAAPDGFVRLQQALGVPARATEGDRLRLAAADGEPIDGVIFYRTPNFIGMRTDTALYRFFGRNAFAMPVGMSIHAFADHVDPENARRRWQDWLDSTFPRS
jgi:hypothetical protein